MRIKKLKLNKKQKECVQLRYTNNFVYVKKIISYK